MSSRLRVDVFADPGVPSQAASHVLAGADTDEAEGDYILSQNKRQIPLRPNGSLDLDTVRQWSRRDEADLLVILTEIPRRVGRRPKIIELHFAEGLAIISVPALGWLRVAPRLRRAVFEALDALAAQQTLGAGSRRVRIGTVYEHESDNVQSAFIASPWWRPGRIRLILGMVRTNEPLSDVLKLSGVLAAATATGAFGIFYSSVWEMANALPAWRLMLIAISAIVLMMVWLIISNQLWERPRQVGGLTEAAMYNASTVATLALTVTTLYLALFAGIFLVSLVIIEANYLAQTLGAEVSLGNYVSIAWLSASLGTVAGALGSNFDDEDDIRNLTHGKRQLQRFHEQKSTESR